MLSPEVRVGNTPEPRMMSSVVPKLVRVALLLEPVKSTTLLAPLPCMLMTPPMAPPSTSVPASMMLATLEPAPASVAVTPLFTVSVPGPVMLPVSLNLLAMVACAPEARLIAAASVPPSTRVPASLMLPSVVLPEWHWRRSQC